MYARLFHVSLMHIAICIRMYVHMHMHIHITHAYTYVVENSAVNAYALG